MTVLVVFGIILQAVFIITEHLKYYTPAVFLKGAASLCFVLLGFLCTFGASNSAGFASLIIYGLIAGFLGDVLLNLRFVFEKAGQAIFLVGILIFLIGHVFYLIGLIKLAKLAFIPLIVGVVLAFFLLKWIFSKVTAKKSFKIFGVFYVGAVTLMTTVAVWNMIVLRTDASTIFAIGSVLFLASDIILIFNTFTDKTRFTMRIANLSLYYIGQLLIAYSLFLL